MRIEEWSVAKVGVVAGILVGVIVFLAMMWPADADAIVWHEFCWCDSEPETVKEFKIHVGNNQPGQYSKIFTIAKGEWATNELGVMSAIVELPRYPFYAAVETIGNDGAATLMSNEIPFDACWLEARCSEGLNSECIDFDFDTLAICKPAPTPEPSSEVLALVAILVIVAMFKLGGRRVHTARAGN